MFYTKIPAFISIDHARLSLQIPFFIAVLSSVAPFSFASQTQTDSVLYVREQTQDMPDGEFATFHEKSPHFLILKDDQTAYETMTPETPIDELTLEDMTASQHGVWVAQQIGDETYLLVRWQEGGDRKFKSLEDGDLRDDSGDFQMALPAISDSFPGVYQADTKQADTKDQVRGQTTLIPAEGVQQQYRFTADGTFQELGYADQASDEARADVGATSQVAKNGSWKLYNYDLTLTYSDGTTRNLKVYNLVDGLYFNEVRFKKIK